MIRSAVASLADTVGLTVQFYRADSATRLVAFCGALRLAASLAGTW